MALLIFAQEQPLWRIKKRAVWRALSKKWVSKKFWWAFFRQFSKLHYCSTAMWVGCGDIMGLWGGGWPGSWSDVATDMRNAELWTSASYPELQECQETRNNCLNKKIFVWNTSDTLQRQDHVKTSSSQMLFIFYILKSEMNFSFCPARYAAAVVCCFLGFNSSLSTDSCQYWQMLSWLVGLL